MFQGTMSLNVVMLVLVGSLAVTLANAGRHRPRGPPQKGQSKCDPCDMRRCQDVRPDTCKGGEIRKDDCDCCPVCHPVSTSNTTASTSLYSTGSNPSRDIISDRGKNACADIDCGNFQICIPNIQNIPICRCQSKIFCRRAKNAKQEELCGENKVLYQNKCFLEAEECLQKKKIRVVQKSVCTGKDRGTPSSPAKKCKNGRKKKNGKCGKKIPKQQKGAEKHHKKRESKSKSKKEKRQKRRERRVHRRRF